MISMASPCLSRHIHSPGSAAAFPFPFSTFTTQQQKWPLESTILDPIPLLLKSRPLLSMAYRIKGKPLHGFRVSSLLCLSLSLPQDPRNLLAFLQLLFALHPLAYPFISWVWFQTTQQASFHIPGKFTKSALPVSFSYRILFPPLCTYYREMSCLLSCLIHVFPVRLQAPQRWGWPHPSYSLLIASPEHNAWHILDTQYVLNYKKMNAQIGLWFFVVSTISFIVSSISFLPSA